MSTVNFDDANEDSFSEIDLDGSGSSSRGAQASRFTSRRRLEDYKLAKELREDLVDCFSDEYEDYAHIMKTITDDSGWQKEA